MLAGNHTKGIFFKIELGQNFQLAPFGVDREIVDMMWRVVLTEQIIERNRLNLVRVLFALQPISPVGILMLHNRRKLGF